MYILRLGLFYLVTATTVVCCILMQILCVVSQKKLQLQTFYRGSLHGPRWVTPSARPLVFFYVPNNPVRWTPLMTGSGLCSILVERSLAFRISAGPLPANSLGQAAHTHVPLSPSCIICLWAMTLLGWEGNRKPGGK